MESSYRKKGEFDRKCKLQKDIFEVNFAVCNKNIYCKKRRVDECSRLLMPKGGTSNAQGLRVMPNNILILIAFTLTENFNIYYKKLVLEF